MSGKHSVMKRDSGVAVVFASLIETGCALVADGGLSVPGTMRFVPERWPEPCTRAYTALVTMPEKVRVDDRWVALQVIVPERDGLRILRELGASGTGEAAVTP